MYFLTIMVHVHLALDHCNVAAVTFTMFWAILLLLLAQHFVFSVFLTATLLLPSTGFVSVLCSFITSDRAILSLLFAQHFMFRCANGGGSFQGVCSMVQRVRRNDSWSEKGILYHPRRASRELLSEIDTLDSEGGVQE